MSGESTNRRERRDRQATEAEILQAFERLLVREGVNAVGINAVAQEAGVNKVLIYRYFGSIADLAREWALGSDLWPSEIELIGGDEKNFANYDVRQRIKRVIHNFMLAIRRRPQTVEVMASELTSPTDMTQALVEGLAKPGSGVGEYINRTMEDDKLLGERVWRLICIVYAVTSYFTIRERTNPVYFGMDLDSDETWDFLIKTVDDLVDVYLRD